VVVVGRVVVPVPVPASAANTPVNGAAEEANANPPAELTVVFVKLWPLPPRLFTRFKVFPLGAVRFIVRSPSQVIFILKFTVTSVMVAPAGMPPITNGVAAPVAEPSGTATLIVPDVCVAAPVLGVTGPRTVSKTVVSPAHIVDDVGDTVIAPGGVETVIANGCMPMQPNTSVPVTVYDVLTVGLAVTTAPVVPLKPVAGVQKNVAAPEAVIVRPVPVEHIAPPSGLNVTTGNG
jgi:hypothetical protein